MSHFYTTVNNSRGKTVSACGTKKIGQSCHIRGWESGCRVEAVHYDTQTGSPDGFKVYATRGSNAVQSDVYIGEIILDYKGNLKFQLPLK